MTTEDLVKYLRENNLTIATMESCTGGYVANEITNIPGASDVLKFSAVTYSTEYKYLMGVDLDIIGEYSVYSSEVGEEMAYSIRDFAKANIGIGITGHLDIGKSDIVYISICYEKEDGELNMITVEYNPPINCNTRKDLKFSVYQKVLMMLESYIVSKGRNG